MVLFVNPDLAATIRMKVGSLGLGDIYTYNQYFYRVQVKGNAVLPIAFFISLFAIQSKRIKIAVASLLLAGLIVAGNLAFILAVLFFIVVYCLVLFFSNEKVQSGLRTFFNSKKRVILSSVVIFIILLAGLYIFVPYFIEVYNRKMEASIPTRFDQVRYLMEDLFETPLTSIFGQGLGNLIYVITDYRDYRTYYYYELQAIYILNQVGILYFLFFWVTQIIFILKFWRNKFAYLIYFSYIIYAATNPYLFDTTNILVLIVVSSLSKLYLREGNNGELKI